MPTIHIEAKLTPEDLIEAVEQLSPPELEEFAQRVLALQAQRKSPSLPPSEADLLRKINEGAPPEMQRQYDELISKRRAETLSPQEYDELLRMTEQMEGVEVRRLECLAELARVRRTPLPTLMKDLGIAPPPYR
jgi:hypothetical protein